MFNYSSQYQGYYHGITIRWHAGERFLSSLKVSISGDEIGHAKMPKVWISVRYKVLKSYDV